MDLVLTYKCSKVIIRCLELDILNVKADDYLIQLKTLANPNKSLTFPINISTSGHFMITFEHL